MLNLCDASIYVQQDDLLFAQLTTAETLHTAVSLRLSIKPSAKDSLVDSFINKLGLKKVSYSRVGNSKSRGISGGEKKRLCIGNELIALASNISNSTDKDSNTIEMKKVAIYCDEPTSGLDSYQSVKVMSVLKELASAGNTVIVSIHQPRSSIYSMFDEISLMSEGRTIYTGTPQEMLIHFKSIGYPCPIDVNPAEYYIDLISIDYSTATTEKDTKERVASLANAFLSKFTNKFASMQSIIKADSDSRHATLSTSSHTISNGKGGILKSISNSFREFRILFRRAWKNVTRDKSLNIARLMSGLFSSLLFGAIYYKMGTTSKSIPDRLGLLQVAAVNTAMSSLIKATTSFVTEKLIVQRERRSASYSVGPYFLSKLVAEAPLSAFFPTLSGFIMYRLCGLNDAPGRLLNFMGILVVESIASTALGLSVGSIAASTESAVAIAPAIMVIFIVFGGLYVVNTPSYLSWVPNVSLIRWAYEALCINEFSGLKLTESSNADSPVIIKTGEEVLSTMGMGSSSVKNALVAQLGIIAFNYMFTYLSLLLQKPTSEQIVSPESADIDGGITNTNSSSEGSSIDTSSSSISSSTIGSSSNIDSSVTSSALSQKSRQPFVMTK